MNDDSAFTKLRDERFRRRSEILYEDEFLWLFRLLEIRYGAHPALLDKMFDLVDDTLFTTLFNKFDDFSFKHVQARAGEYLSETPLHCTRLRNFFLAVLMRHIKQLYILPPKQFDRSLIVILVAIGGAGAIYNYIGSVWTCAPRADDRNRRSGRERMLDMRDPERCELIRACAALLLARADARVTLRASAKGLTALN